MMLCPLILELPKLLHKSKNYSYTKTALATYMEGIVLLCDIVPTSSLAPLELQMYQEKMIAGFYIVSTKLNVNRKLHATVVISK